MTSVEIVHLCALKVDLTALVRLGNRLNRVKKSQEIVRLRISA